MRVGVIVVIGVVTFRCCSGVSGGVYPGVFANIFELMILHLTKVRCSLSDLFMLAEPGMAYTFCGF